MLQEAKEYNLDEKKLDEASALLTASGDTLREFALKCVQASKNFENFDSKKVSEVLLKASEYEEKVYKILKTTFI